MSSELSYAYKYQIPLIFKNFCDDPSPNTITVPISKYQVQVPWQKLKVPGNVTKHPSHSLFFEKNGEYIVQLIPRNMSANIIMKIFNPCFTQKKPDPLNCILLYMQDMYGCSF